jgi:hypothetical protein
MRWCRVGHPRKKSNGKEPKLIIGSRDSQFENVVYLPFKMRVTEA